jgi:hypothetical protein
MSGKLFEQAQYSTAVSGRKKRPGLSFAVKTELLI